MDRPADAIGEYRYPYGPTLWVKDITVDYYPMGRLWSKPQNRWRKKREAIKIAYVTTFEPKEQ